MTTPPVARAASAPARPRGRVIAQVIMIIVGLAFCVAGVIMAIHPSTRCYDQNLQPGQVCAKADGSAGASYETRISEGRIGAGIFALIGLGVAGFGSYLLVQQRRRAD